MKILGSFQDIVGRKKFIAYGLTILLSYIPLHTTGHLVI